VSDPLRLSFVVTCDAEHAFVTWTQRIAVWWPTDHTVSGTPDSVVFEGRVGERIYERTAHGEEHEWGVVTLWRPPDLVSYRWYLGVDFDRATDVAVRFVPLDAQATRVEIEQSGWERLGADATELRDRNRSGWESLLPHFRAAI